MLPKLGIEFKCYLCWNKTQQKTISSSLFTHGPRREIIIIENWVVSMNCFYCPRVLHTKTVCHTVVLAEMPGKSISNKNRHLSFFRYFITQTGVTWSMYINAWKRKESYCSKMLFQRGFPENFWSQHKYTCNGSRASGCVVIKWSFSGVYSKEVGSLSVS